MGSTKSLEMDHQVHVIWHWAISSNNWVTATHIPGILNVEADQESREQATRTEWMLNKKDFQQIIQTLEFNPTIDLFASRLNTQLTSFVSYRPDPNSQAVNAFTIEWGDKAFYAFPPFACIPKVIQKIWQDNATGILIVPDWPNQPWYGQYLDIINKEVILYPRSDLLILPHNNMKHPLHRTLQLRAAVVSRR